MSKAVMISIRQKWCEKIARGEKTIEVRKTRPKLETPFKCYIYETQGKTDTPWVDEDGHMIFSGRGMVIGEFTCDRIYNIDKDSVDFIFTPTPNGYAVYKKAAEERCGLCAAMTDDELHSYLGHFQGFGWHISDLKSYDVPKKLTEFHTWKKCKSCSKSGYESTSCIYDENCMVPVAITKAPQSWCYVEEI